MAGMKSMRTMRRMLACTLVPIALVAAAPAPPPPLSGWPAGDRVYALAGPWACRSVDGAVVRSSGTRAGDMVQVHDDVTAAGKRSSFDDRFAFDAAQQRWRVASELAGFHGDASPWLGDAWTIQGDDVNHVQRKMVLEALPGGDFRRTLWSENGAAVFVIYSAERCTPGTEPPPATACIAERYPAVTLEAVPADARVPAYLRNSTVLVVVSLNTRSEVVGARVHSSPADVLNGPALAAARASKFRTMIVNCEPVAADYIFSVNFG